MDAATDRCIGCLRTREEIAAWPALDDAGKRAILARLEQRREEHFTDYKGLPP